MTNLRKDVHNIIMNAGSLIIKESASKLTVRTKSTERDLVTQIDWNVENFLKEELQKLLPGSSFLAEETDSEIKEAEQLWIIDPIDGTTNLVHGFPFIAVSVALQIEGELKLGFVYNPFLNEFFEAEKGKGSLLNNKSIHVSATRSLSRSLLATGFAYNFNKAEENNIRYFEHFHSKCHGIRRPGSAALDLCYVARGVFDGFWEWYLNPWDVAAGILLVSEAGGRVTDLTGMAYEFTTDSILATNSAIHNDMLSEVRLRCRTDSL